MYSQSETRYHKGDQIGGRYLVHQALAGGMGEVYLCLDMQQNLPVALKTFQERHLHNSRLQQLFEREVATWVALEKHPNIVRCFYMDTVDRQPFMVLEWVRGEEGHGTDLREWLHRRGQMEPRTMMDFAIDICRGLVHARERSPGLVHCDLKPENVLVAQGRLAKITDFGLAKVVLEAGLAATGGGPVQRGRRQVSAAGGTPPYMAPEQWRGEAVDGRTDVYGVGCILYELLTGRMPYQGTSIDELRWQHLNAAVPNLGGDTACSKLLGEVLQRCLAKDASGRYSSAAELLEELAGLYGKLWEGEQPRALPAVATFNAADYNNRGITYHILGKTSEALADCDQAIQLDPKCATAYRNRGNTYHDLGRHADALADYGQAIQLDPNDAAGYYNRGRTHYALGRHAEALTDLDQAIQLDPDDAQAYNNRGITYDALGRHADALTDYDQAIQLDPKYAEAYLNRGNTYHNLGRYADALTDYDQAIHLNPNEASGYVNRGATYRVVGRYAEALSDLDLAIRLGPNEAAAYINRGTIYRALGRHADASVDYDQAIRLDPKCAATYHSRGL